MSNRRTYKLADHRLDAKSAMELVIVPGPQPYLWIGDDIAGAYATTTDVNQLRLIHTAIGRVLERALPND